jgi:hypothetical protein
MPAFLIMTFTVCETGFEVFCVARIREPKLLRYSSGAPVKNIRQSILLPIKKSCLGRVHTPGQLSE